jgi:pyruvate, water dikinase
MKLFEVTRRLFCTPAPAEPTAATVAGGIARLDDRATFEAYAKRDDAPGAASVLASKFLVVGVDTAAPKVWFINSNQHDYHYYFARDSLGVTLSLAEFNRRTYFTDARHFIAGTIVAHDRFEATGIYVVEFWPTDPVKAPHVKLAYDLIAAGMAFASGKLAYHPAGDTQELLADEERAQLAAANVRVISTDELFRGVAYSPLNQAVGFGILRIVDPAHPSAVPLSPRDIVVFRSSTPNDLQRVGGIITEVPQTPLSHINLKARQDKVPNAYIQGAATDPRLAPLIGTAVRFEVRAEDFTVAPATAAEIDEFLETLRPREPQIPPSDLSRREILGFADIGVRDAKIYGGKTANLAELARILPAGVTPQPGFGVPFACYADFVRENRLDQAIAEMLADPAFASDLAVRERALADLRKQFRKGKVPSSLRDQLDDLQGRFPDASGIRLRSSTNNEDLEGFVGAGLYDSFTCRLADGETIVDEIRKVWASLWNFRAFEERTFWRIPHDAVQMGVTVHPNVDGELANGVAITRNIYDASWPGFYINAQVGEDLVTNPDPLSTPEEMLVSAIGENGEYEVQRIRRSSLTGGKPVLDARQRKDLVDALAVIQAHFKTILDHAGDDGFAMDVEWKVLPTGAIYVKQARPAV